MSKGRITYHDADLKVFQENVLANRVRGAIKKVPEVLTSIPVQEKKRTHKFNAKRATVDGNKFDSTKEANRYGELKLLEKNKFISDLRLQVKYPITMNNVHICDYIADFTYWNEKKEFVVEDSKGMRTPEYKLKKKMMEAVYNIIIYET